MPYITRGIVNIISLGLFNIEGNTADILPPTSSGEDMKVKRE